MLTSIFNAGSFSVESVLIAMGAALVLGVAVGSFYKLFNAEAGGFAIVIAVLPMLVTTVIMIVNGNLGPSVAVLGAFGLVRFRSAPGSAKEICFIFFTMVIGLATGMGFLTLAVLLTVVLALLIVALEKLGFGTSRSKEKELRITIPEDLNYNGIFDDLFAAYTKKAYLEQVKTTNMGTMYELSYRVTIRNPADEKEFMDALRCRNGNLTIILGYVQKPHNVL